MTVLSWELAHGSKPPQLLRELADAGLIPESDAAPPILRRGLSFIYNAFWTLSTERMVEQGAIPFSAIDGFARRYGIGGDQFDRFRALMVSLDNCFRQTQAREIKTLYDSSREGSGSKKLPKPL